MQGPRAGTGRWTAIGVVQLLVGALVALVVLGAGAAVVSRVQVDSSIDRLKTRVVPAGVAAAALRQGYTDQAAGHLAYLLTGGTIFLNRYENGIRTATKAASDVRRLLPGDAQVTALLARLDDAAQRWRSTAVEPQQAARRSGPIPTTTLIDDITATSSLYDSVRNQVGALDVQTRTLEAHQLSRIQHAQRTANVVSAGAIGLTVLVALLGLVALQRALVRPARRLLRDVDTVALGAYEHPISVSGPSEFGTVANAVDRMRANILRHADELVETRRKLAVAEEHERFAADLHDRTIQRMFALGITLNNVAVRFPTLAPSVEPLVDEADEILRELRTVIFGLRRDDVTVDLRADIDNLAHESARSLGFSPEVTIAGPIADASPAIALELLSTLREVLSNVAKHAEAKQVTVRVEVADDRLHLLVRDDGVGFDTGDHRAGYGLANVKTRAEKLGGEANITSAPGDGTTVDWQVPLGTS